MNIDLNKNSFMLTVNDKQFDYTCSIFKKYNINAPIKIQGIISNNHEYACRIGHAKMIQEAKNMGFPYMIAFEDDAYPCDDCINKFNELIERNKDIQWDILQIGICGEHSNGFEVFGNDSLNYDQYMQSNNVEFVTDDLLKIHECIHGATAYIVKQNVYDSLIKIFENEEIAIDYALAFDNLNKFNIKCYVTKKMFFAQHRFIRNTNEHLWWMPYFYNKNEIQRGPVLFHVKKIPIGYSI